MSFWEYWFLKNFCLKSSLYSSFSLQIAFPVWLFWSQFLMLDVFLRFLVLLSFLIFKSGEFKTLIGISDIMKEVSYLWALLYDDLAGLFSCEDPAISVFRVLLYVGQILQRFTLHSPLRRQRMAVSILGFGIFPS